MPSNTITKKSNAEFLKWFKPVLDALKELGGSATPTKVREQIITDLHLTDDIVNETYGKSNTNKFANQVAFARNYLVYAGYIDKSQSGIWSLTESGKTVEMTDKLASDIFITNAPKHVSKEMFSHEERIEKLLDFYKKSFPKHWEEEKYKWQAVKSFQINFDIDADNFAEMFKKAVKKADNLLGSVGSYPAGQIQDFAKEFPNETRSMFKTLYDENLDLEKRLEDFKKASVELIERHNSTLTKDNNKYWKSSYQNENSISTYLWLKYPDKYYIYKFGEIVKAERFLYEKPTIKKGEGVKNFLRGKEIYDELCEVLKADDEIKKLLKDSLSDDCYADPNLRTLAIDVGFQFSRYYDDEQSTTIVNNSSVHYWLYAPGEKASKWDEFYKKGIMGLGWDEISDLREFDSRDEIKAKLKEIHGEASAEINSSLALWEFANLMKPGDIIFVKKGMFKILGRGVVDSEYYYDSSEKEYPHIRKVKWTHNEEHDHPGQAVMKTLTDITDYTEYVGKLNSLFEVEDEPSEIKSDFEPYDEDSFFNEVFISPEKYETIVNLLERKKNIILQGAPGVGKSYAAKRLAYSIIGEKNTDQVKLVQFHQSYSYEDFIVGFRPSEKENKQFEKKYGVFYEFCKKAIDDSDNKYFFIIDEINRGNMSKIFGELLLLIESDKRGSKNKIQLLYSNEDFYVPENVYIIGMMNTADRSLAMIDYALRRRFAFVEFKPAFESDGFKQKQNEISNEKYNRLIDCVKELNEKIISDVSLGKGFRIGHSYFIPKNDSDVDDEWLSDVVHYELIPLLEEYWFDETDTLSEWKRRLEDSIR